MGGGGHHSALSLVAYAQILQNPIYPSEKGERGLVVAHIILSTIGTKWHKEVC